METEIRQKDGGAEAIFMLTARWRYSQYLNRSKYCKKKNTVQSYFSVLNFSLIKISVNPKVQRILSCFPVLQNNIFSHQDNFVSSC